MSERGQPILGHRGFGVLPLAAYSPSLGIKKAPSNDGAFSSVPKRTGDLNVTTKVAITSWQAPEGQQQEPEGRQEHHSKAHIRCNHRC